MVPMNEPSTIPEISDPNSARIYAIVARTRRRAVVFRRGPRRRTRLILWNLNDDTFELGQWLSSRIYERRCDLTPDGKKLVYFAASFRNPFYSWTAISKPPYLTALALWPKGDCWGGGGLFDSEWGLRLNHRPIPWDAKPDQHEMQLADGFTLPPKLKIEPLGEHSGWGEDQPIMSMRLERDGWVLVTREVAGTRPERPSRFGVTFDPPITMQKPIGPNPQGTGLFLHTYLHAKYERNARKDVETANIVDGEGRVMVELGRIDWADLDHNRDVIYANEGCLFRLSTVGLRRNGELPEKRLIADLNAMEFEPIEPPDWARRWR